MASVCPTPPTIPPCCEMTKMVMNAQYHSSQLTLSLGPGTLFNAFSGVWLQVIVYRPNSICVDTFTTQPRIISQSSQNPASAPALVVAISSPEPTIEPAIIMPGPSRSSVAPNVRGGACGVTTSGRDTSLVDALCTLGGALLTVHLPFLRRLKESAFDHGPSYFESFLYIQRVGCLYIILVLSATRYADHKIDGSDRRQ